MLARQNAALCEELAKLDRALGHKPPGDLEAVGRRIGRWLDRWPRRRQRARRPRAPRRTTGPTAPALHRPPRAARRRTPRTPRPGAAHPQPVRARPSPPPRKMQGRKPPPERRGYTDGRAKSARELRNLGWSDCQRKSPNLEGRKAGRDLLCLLSCFPAFQIRDWPLRPREKLLADALFTGCHG
jgi:hypothetical protein